VMDFHRLLVDVRFERVGCVGKGRKGISHQTFLLVGRRLASGRP
jgi:hypothetical protein